MNLKDAVCTIEKESKMLTNMAVTLGERVTKLRDHIMRVDHQEDYNSRKRVLDDHSVDDFMVNYKGGRYPDGSSEADGFCCKRANLLHTKPKALKILVRTQQSDTSLVVQDGYQWRKYGQKVTRDNPYPRAYFKCSYAPICPVKKKVQRSVEDPAVLVVTYHGEHNHKKPSDSSINGSILFTIDPVESSSNTNTNTNNYKNKVDDDFNHSLNDDSQIPACSSSTLATTLHLIQHNVSDDTRPKQREVQNDFNNSHDHQLHRQLVLQQIALSLAKEPYFATALAAAVSGNMQELE